MNVQGVHRKILVSRQRNPGYWDIPENCPNQAVDIQFCCIIGFNFHHFDMVFPTKGSQKSMPCDANNETELVFFVFSGGSWHNNDI